MQVNLALLIALAAVGIVNIAHNVAIQINSR